MNTTETIQSRIQELSQALLSAHPTMPTLLRDIHRQLKEDPAIVTLLAPEEIRIIVNGLEKQTMTTLASSVTKSSSASKNLIKKLTSKQLDDLF